MSCPRTQHSGPGEGSNPGHPVSEDERTNYEATAPPNGEQPMFNKRKTRNCSLDSNRPRTPRAPCFQHVQTSWRRGETSVDLQGYLERGSPWPLRRFKVYLFLYFDVSYNLD